MTYEERLVLSSSKCLSNVHLRTFLLKHSLGLRLCVANNIVHYSLGWKQGFAAPESWDFTRKILFSGHFCRGL